MLINPNLVSMLLGIACLSTDAMVFPNQGIDKTHIFELFGRQGNTWFWEVAHCGVLHVGQGTQHHPSPQPPLDLS